MTKKLLSIITLLLLTTSSLFAESIGFASVHSGFWWWAGAVAIPYVAIILIIELGMVLGLDVEYFLILIPVTVFAILGFFVIPSIWCGLVFGIVGAILYSSLLYCILEDSEPLSWILSLLICAITIAAEVFVMIYLPNNWWLWKYVSVAVLGSGIANILAFDCDEYDPIAAPLIDVILLIADFIAFWIVFGIYRWNVASITLGIIFCSLVFITLISPFICMLIEEIDRKIYNRKKNRIKVKKIEKIAVDISKNQRFIELHPEDKEFYKDNKTNIDNRVQKILNDIKQQETKKIQEEQAQKKLEREEEARETAFQRNLESISEDIDALEQAVGEGNFNIQLLTILEKHISVLSENKTILNEHNKNTIQRKKKYLQDIFKDCESLKDCKGSAKTRMKEILKMLEDLS